MRAVKHTFISLKGLSASVFAILDDCNGEIHCQICNCIHTYAPSSTRQRMQAEKDEK